MKQISIVLTFFFVAFSINGYAQTDTTLKKILLINLTSYKQKPVDSLFKKLPTNYTKTTVFGSRRSNYGNSLVVMYPNDVSVWIVVGTFKYFNPHLDFSKPLKGQWDANIPLFKKERMAYAIVYQGNTCYGGCENDIKSQWERKIKH